MGNRGNISLSATDHVTVDLPQTQSRPIAVLVAVITIIRLSRPYSATYGRYLLRTYALRRQTTDTTTASADSRMLVVGAMMVTRQRPVISYDQPPASSRQDRRIANGKDLSDVDHPELRSSAAEFSRPALTEVTTKQPEYFIGSWKNR